MNALGIIAFAVALLVSVVIHEAGHFLSAKAFGMKATQFFVGFGPTLFSRKHGETEYGVKAIPAGGFVKIIGMTPLEEVDPADSKRAFFRQPTPQRVIVLAAGSTMHFVIAIMLTLGVAFFTQQPTAGVVIGQVEGCTPVVAPTQDGPPTLAESLAASGVCGGNYKTSPAMLAGLRAGDNIIAINGHTLTNTDDPAKLVRTTVSAHATFTVQRAGRTLQLSADLASVNRDRATGAAGSQQAYALGVAFSSQPAGYVNPTYSSGLHLAGQYLGFNSQSVLFGFFPAIAHIGSEASQLFNSDRGQQSGAQLQSVVGIAQVSGDIFAAKQVPTSVRVGDFLLIVAAVNASVGILNLLPLLPFDGGHIAVTLAERATRRRQRRGRVADTGKRIGQFYTRAAPGMYAVSLVIIIFSVVVLVADVKNPVT